MENRKINYMFVPSLKHIALVKITVALWNRSAVRDLVAKGLQIVVAKVEGIVPELPLPEKLKMEISYLVKPVVSKIERWKMNYNRHITLDLVRNLPDKLCFTPHGTVNEKKTAELFVKEESLHITERFRIACVYCLEEEIRVLWNSVPQDIFDKDVESIFRDCPLMVFWIYDLKGKLTEFSDLVARLRGSASTPYQFAFECAVSGCLKAAIEYFLQKLTPSERGESLVRCAAELAREHFNISNIHPFYPEADYYADTLCFLLSQMNEEQQAKVFEREPTGVLSCLLCWPWQSFFMETAICVWDFLSNLSYQTLLKLITIKMVNHGYKNYNYQKLLGEFWKHSPSAFKKHFMGCPTSAALLLRNLFQLEDKENIMLVLKGATPKEKEDILFETKEGKYSKESTSEREKVLWEELFHFLNDIIHNDKEKRNAEDGNSSPPKRMKFSENL